MILLIASVFSSSVLAAAYADVTIENAISETTDGTVQVAFDVNASTSSENVSLNTLTETDTGQNISLSQTVDAGSTVTLHTANGTDDTSNIYLNWSADLPLAGNLTLDYTVNGTSYSETVSYDFDADNDGVADNNDDYPDNAPVNYTHDASDNETVSSVYVTAENGSFAVSVYGIDTDGNETQVGNNSFTVDGSEMTEITVENGTYDQYRVQIEGNATVTDHGLIYSADTGATSNESSITPEQLLGGGAIVVGIVLVVYLRD
ncbi:hypothetical protein ACFQH6_15115 [Halobacteriaceae archaeon GCM10025711]